MAKTGVSGVIEIVCISNAHQWDGQFVSEQDFVKIIQSLELSRYVHTIKYIQDGVVRTIGV